MFRVTLAVLAAAAVVSAQTRPQQAPVFRARTDLVQVDVSVLDGQRRPVRSLKPSDFTLFEDGQPQDIVAFNEFTASDPEAPPDSWLRTVVPDVTVNNAEDGRLLLIVMDDAHTPVYAQRPMPGQPEPSEPRATAKQIARSIVERMGPADLASVIFTVKNKHEQEFTSDRNRLFAAIEGFQPIKQGLGADADIEMLNAMLATSTFSDAAKVLGSIPQRRKAIILISPSAPPVIPLEILPGYVRDAKDVRLEGLRQDALEWAMRGNVTFYNISPMRMAGLDAEVERMLGPDAAIPASPAATFGAPTSGLPPAPRRFDRYEHPVFGTPLDQLTGGFSIRNAAQFAEGVTQIFRESGAYYLLGYVSPNLKDDGRPRRIEVRLTNPSLVVRARGAVIPPKREREVKNASPMWTAISGLTPAKDVAMRINVAPFAIPGKKEVALAITLGLRQPVSIADGPAVKESVSFLTQAFTTNGDRRGSPRYHTVELDLRSNPSGEVKYEILSRLDLKPGRYHIRLSATSKAFAKSGSIYHDIEIPDFSKPPLSLSGVVVSTTPPLVSGPRELLATLLPAVPTTQREFAGHRGSAYLRIYQGGKAAIVPVTMAARIVDANDRVMLEQAENVAADRFDKHRAAEYRFTLPVERLQPGTYLLTLQATAGDLPAVTRDVRFMVSLER